MKKLLMLFALLTMSVNSFNAMAIGSLRTVNLTKPSEICMEIAGYYATNVSASPEAPDNFIDQADKNGLQGEIILRVKKADLEELKVDLHYQGCQFQVEEIAKGTQEEISPGPLDHQ